MAEEKILGIDLGTTNSCVGIYRNKTVDIIANEHGLRTTPSYVAFTQGPDGERLIGNPAKNQQASNVKNTIYDIKRLMGMKYSDRALQNELKYLAYKVVDKNDKPYVEVEYKDEVKQFSPEEISAMILGYLKKVAEDYLGHSVKKAVITVPAYFSDSARQATKDAAMIAGLDCIRIINEPTAAALAYNLDKTTGDKKEKTICVVDIGGGTSDFSILSIDDGMTEVLATSGNSHLAGEDIDNVLLEYCLTDIKRKHKMDLSKNERAKRRLKSACESAKRTLSSSTMANIEIESLLDGNDYSTKLSRAKFDELVLPILQNILKPLDLALTDSKLSKPQINEVVLVGGTTRIPKLQDMLKTYFNGKELCKSLNPDECVAYGAAVQGAILSGVQDEQIDQILLLDVTPLTLSVETAGGVATNMITRNSQIPTKKSMTFSNYADMQRIASIVVLEGERQLAKDNNTLGKFDLEIPPASRGTLQIEVTFSVDANSILQVSALEKSTGKSKNITIQQSNNKLSKDDIERMVAEAEKFKEEDQKLRDKIEAKNNLESYAYQMRSSTTGEFKDKLSEDDKKVITDKTDEVIAWLDNNPTATKEEYDEQRKQLEDAVFPLLQKAYGANAGGSGMPDMGNMRPEDLEEMMKNQQPSANSDHIVEDLD